MIRVRNTAGNLELLQQLQRSHVTFTVSEDQQTIEITLPACMSEPVQNKSTKHIACILYHLPFFVSLYETRYYSLITKNYLVSSLFVPQSQSQENRSA